MPVKQLRVEVVATGFGMVAHNHNSGVFIKILFFKPINKIGRHNIGAGCGIKLIAVGFRALLINIKIRRVRINGLSLAAISVRRCLARAYNALSRNPHELPWSCFKFKPKRDSNSYVPTTSLNPCELKKVPVWVKSSGAPFIKYALYPFCSKICG